VLLLLLWPGRETPPRYQREVAHVRQKEVQPTPPLHPAAPSAPRRVTLCLHTRTHAQQYKVRHRQRERKKERGREREREREREGVRAQRVGNFCVLKSDVLQGIGYLLTHDEWIFGSTTCTRACVQ